MLGYLSLDIEGHSFHQAMLGKLLGSFSEQLRFPEKYQSIFLHQMEAIVYTVNKRAMFILHTKSSYITSV